MKAKRSAAQAIPPAIEEDKKTPIRDIEFSERVYEQMRLIAARKLARRSDATLSPSALVNETYLRLLESADLRFVDRNHFVSVAVRTMRWIISDYARKKKSHKRGGGALRVTLSSDAAAVSALGGIDIVGLDVALERLEKVDPRLCQVIELRFLVGLSVRETADLLKVSTSTVKRDWELARAWLFSELKA